MIWRRWIVASLVGLALASPTAVAGEHNYSKSTSQCVDDDFGGDDDGDGWGDGDMAALLCGTVDTIKAGDCSDDPDERPDDCTASPGSIYPGATEACNGCDDDCDTEIDEVNASGCVGYYPDSDGDGYGDVSRLSLCLCDAISGYARPTELAECDSDAGRNPVQTETCNGKDDNCDGTVDEGVTTRYYLDQDGDEYGDLSGAFKDLCAPEGDYGPVKETNTDCDDGDKEVNPGVDEITCNSVDDDCSSATLDNTEDVDRDGYSVCAGDCDDDDDLRSPGLTEDCSTPTDDNCDGLVDATDALHCSYYYEDADSDGYGNLSSRACLCGPQIPFVVEGTTSATSDCNDDPDSDILGGGANIHPDAVDDCDPSYGVEGDQVDADCDGSTLGIDALGCVEFSQDADTDGYGDPATTECTCYAEDSSYQLVGDAVVGVADDTDCDDANPRRAPDLPEECEEPYGTPQVDNDCDGDPNTQYDPTSETVDYIESDELSSACEDTGCTDLAAYPYYPDADGDGYGAGEPVYLCGEPIDDFSTLAGDNRIAYAASGGDCADDSPEVHPGADELCNNRDDDCDTNTDEPDDLGLTSGCVDMHPDRDLDGYGDESSDSTTCLCYTSTLVDEHAADCTPLEGDPGQDASGTFYYYYDGVCWTLDDADCYDYSQAIRPGATEALDGDDTNCDDGVLLAELDCDDDGSFAVAPGPDDGEVTPSPDLLGLTDCAGSTDTLLTCWDGVDVRATCGRDGLMVVDRTDEALAEHFDGGKRVWPDGTLTDTHGDCDDLCTSRYPGNRESCDGLDNDCSSLDSSTAIESSGGIPASMDPDQPRPGTISSSEMDLDGDGFVSCTDIPDPEQAYVIDRSCADAGTFEGRTGDCNDFCYAASPDATEESCDGFLDVCDGEAEGTDADGDGFRTCGVFGTGDAAELPDEVYLLVWFNPGSRGADSGDEGAHGSVVPLLAPRPDALEECDATLADRLEDSLGATRAQAVLSAAAAVEDPADPKPGELGAIVEPMLQACICADVCGRDPDACPETCGVVSGACAVARVTLAVGADAGIDTRSLSEEVTEALGSCLDHPDQLAWRTEWSRDRILQARRLVQEWHCYALDGSYGCGDLEGEPPVAIPAFDSAEPGGNIDSPLTQAPLEAAEWWPLLGRFSPEPVREGLYAGCWGDPRQGVEHTSLDVGGDCDDATDDANRGLAEGPGDILVPWFGGGDCDVCVDGVDNNCDGRIDCEDPSCAACFVGVGAGCGDPDAPCDGSGGCRTGPTAPAGIAAALALFLAGALRSRRR